MVGVLEENAVVAEPAVAEVPTPEKQKTREKVTVSIVPMKKMQVPKGYKADAAMIVTEDNVGVPWRLLTPTGEKIEQ